MFGKARQVKKKIKAGDQFLGAKDFAQAEACYREALALDVTSAEALYSLGCVASHRGVYGEAENWARQALAQQPGYRHAIFLLANAQFGAGRHEEALATLLEAQPRENELAPRVQIGFLHEKLGRWKEAEAIFRAVLECHSTTYMTRYDIVALHDYNPFTADVQHALARVLQRQGQRKEAWLHYHLAKRMDPTLELDPMFREILTEEDLENHPYFDVKEAEEPTETAKWEEQVRFVLEQKDYDRLVELVKQYRFANRLQELSNLIQVAQHFGHFQASARLRVVGDAANGDDGRLLFEALQQQAIPRLLELAEVRHRGDLGEPETAAMARRVAIEPGVVPVLVGLVRRFVRLQPETGRTVTFVARAGLLGSRDPEAQAWGHFLWGECCYLLRQPEEAEAALSEACRGFEQVQVGGLAGSAFEYLIRVQIEQGRQSLAIDTASRLSALVERSDNPEALAPGRLKPPENVLHDLLARGEKAISEGEASEARNLLESARIQALDQRRYPELIRALFFLGTVHHETGDFAAAREYLREALGRAEPIAVHVDVWPILIELSYVEEEAGEHAAAVDFAERSLAEARREADREREGTSHGLLARLLIESDSGRAIEHFGEFLHRAPAQPESRPELLLRAQELYEGKRFPEAVAAFEAYLLEGARTPEDRTVALINLGTARCQMGNHREGLRDLSQAVEESLEQGLQHRAIEVLARLIFLQSEAGEDSRATFARMAAVARAAENPGTRREGLSQAAGVAVDIGEYAEAEHLGRAALALAVSEEWRDRGTETDCRMTLGRLFRATGRYQEAVEQYESALALARYLRNEPLEGTIHGWKAVAHRYLHQIQMARQEYDQAIEIARRYRDTTQEASHRFNSAQVLLDLGLREEALEATLAAWRLAEQSGPRQLAERILLTMTMQWKAHELPPDVATRARAAEERALESPISQMQSLARAQKAERLIGNGSFVEGVEIYDEAIASFARSGDRYNHAAAYLNRARALADHDRVTAAKDAVEARQLAEAIRHDRLVSECDEFFLELGLRYSNADQVESALRALIPAWLSLRMALQTDADRVRFVDSISHFVERSAALFLAQDRPRQAFDVLEWGRAQALTDLIAANLIEPEGCEEPALQRAEPLPPRQPETTKSSAELLSMLSRPAVLISLSYVGEDLVGMAFRPGQGEPQRVPLQQTRSAIRAWLEDYRLEMHRYRGQGAMTWLDRGRELLRRLDLYIKPDDLVVFAVEEDLQILPLAGIPLPDGRPLIERAAVVYTPSLTVLRQLAERSQVREQARRLDLLSFGIAFPDEALALQQVFGGGMALTGNALDKENIRVCLPGKSVVHFACHGHFDADLPLLSGLHLRTPSSPFLRDVLTVQDLSRWRMDCNLITLSACETGLGEVAASEFLGLTRSLLAAGANSVLATLWPVRRHSTQELMLAFYGELAHSRKDTARGIIDTAEALRRTQLQFCNSSAFYDWAAFKLIGWPIFPVGQSKGLPAPEEP